MINNNLVSDTGWLEIAITDVGTTKTTAKYRRKNGFCTVLLALTLNGVTNDKIIATGLPAPLGAQVMYINLTYLSVNSGGSPNGFVLGNDLYINPRGYSGLVFAAATYPIN